MTKQQAIKMFRETYADYMKENHKDKIAIKTAWNDFTDGLCKDNMITEKQYKTWTNPF